MTTVFRRAKVPYSCAQMYGLISDIEGYSHFVPNCIESTVDETIAGSEVCATLCFQYKGINLGFTTLNQNTPSSLIKMKLVEGPFKYLEGEWEFLPLDGHGSEVSLKIDFDFSNRVYAAMLKVAFNRLTLSMLDAFVERARTLYEPR